MCISTSISALFRVSIGLMFVVAGAIKLQDLQAFADSISSFEILPHSLVNLWAMTLPPFELIIGAMLLTGYRRQVAAFSALLLLTLFCIVFGQALLRGLPIDCGCFGSEKPAFWRDWASFLRDILLLTMTWWLYRHFLLQDTPSSSS